MENKEHLSENTYQKNKSKLSVIAIAIFVIGILIGGSLITLGIINNGKINSMYSDENKSDLTKKLNIEKEKLELKKSELEAKGLTYNAFANYTDEESYELKVITKALDPSFNYCDFDEYKNNSTTSVYCSLKYEIEELNRDFNKNSDLHKNIPLFMFGGFIIVAFGMIAFSIYMMSKRREIMAFHVQQVMPIAQEGIEKIAPTLGKAKAEMTKQMAPLYGEVAKEI